MINKLRTIYPASPLLEKYIYCYYIFENTAANFKHNVVSVQQSCIKAFTFYVSPELVDVNKPVKIYVNDTLVFNARVKMDKNVILNEFIKTKDRSVVVVNKSGSQCRSVFYNGL
jgi:hypothetical protein